MRRPRRTSRLAALLPPRKPVRLPLKAVPRVLHWAFVSVATLWLAAFVAFPEGSVRCFGCTLRRYDELMAKQEEFEASLERENRYMSLLHRPDDSPTITTFTAPCGMQLAEQFQDGTFDQSILSFSSWELRRVNDAMAAEATASLKPDFDEMWKWFERFKTGRATPGCSDCRDESIDVVIRDLQATPWPWKPKPPAGAPPAVAVRARRNAR